MPLEEMDVIDSFLFTEIVYDEETGSEVCRMMTESEGSICIPEEIFRKMQMSTTEVFKPF